MTGVQMKMGTVLYVPTFDIRLVYACPHLDDAELLYFFLLDLCGPRTESDVVAESLDGTMSGYLRTGVGRWLHTSHIAELKAVAMIPEEATRQARLRLASRMSGEFSEATDDRSGESAEYQRRIEDQRTRLDAAWDSLVYPKVALPESETLRKFLLKDYHGLAAEKSETFDSKSWSVSWTDDGRDFEICIAPQYGQGNYDSADNKLWVRLHVDPEFLELPEISLCSPSSELRNSFEYRDGKWLMPLTRFVETLESDSGVLPMLLIDGAANSGAVLHTN